MKSRGKIFLIDDDELICSMLSRALKNNGYEIRTETKGHDVINKIRSWFPDIVMLDIKLPGKSGIEILEEFKSNGIESQIVMLTSDDTAETAVKCMKLGAVDYLTKPFNMDEVRIVIDNIMEKEDLKREVEYLRKISCSLFERELIGESSAIKELRTKAEKIAEAHVSTVLITGESGTGKEIIARYIHRLMYGEYASGCAPFIAVNCSALPEPLLESELFGHEKGAFTDARSDKKGMFELAQEGTILLDEIGDMKQNLQSKLLRVLEERTLRRIGGNEEIPVDVTVIATTNRNLSEVLESGEFRKDLFFRLSAFYMHIPPLRERSEDIPLLARHFLAHYSTKYNRKTIKGFSPEAETLMTTYSWPGNVRELKNLVEGFVVLENTEVIQPEHLPRWMTGESVTSGEHSKDRFVLPETGISLEELEKDLFIQALERAGNNKTLAAKLLNISYDSFRYGLKKFGLG